MFFDSKRVAASDTMLARDLLPFSGQFPPCEPALRCLIGRCSSGNSVLHSQQNHTRACWCRLVETQQELQAKAVAQAKLVPHAAALPMVLATGALPAVTASRGSGPWFAVLMQQWQAAGIPPLGLPFTGVAPIRSPAALHPITSMAAWYSQRVTAPAGSAPVQTTRPPAPFSHPAMPLHSSPYGWGAGPLQNPYAAAFSAPAFPAQQQPWQQVLAAPAPPHLWSSAAQLGLDAAEVTPAPVMPAQAAVVVTGANFDPEITPGGPESAADALPAAANDTDTPAILCGHGRIEQQPDAGHARTNEVGTVNDIAVTAADGSRPETSSDGRFMARGGVGGKRSIPAACAAVADTQLTGTASKRVRRT